MARIDVDRSLQIATVDITVLGEGIVCGRSFAPGILTRARTHKFDSVVAAH
jgi:hypothetical protein